MSRVDLSGSTTPLVSMTWVLNETANGLSQCDAMGTALQSCMWNSSATRAAHSPSGVNAARDRSDAADVECGNRTSKHVPLAASAITNMPPSYAITTTTSSGLN